MKESECVVEKLGESVAGRVEKRCAKLERTKGAFLSGDPKDSASTPKKIVVASL